MTQLDAAAQIRLCGGGGGGGNNRGDVRDQTNTQLENSIPVV